MTDLVFYAANKATIREFARNHPDGNALWVEDARGDVITGKEGGWARDGVHWMWWPGGGKVMTAKAVTDGDTTITPAVFAPGVAALVRLSAPFTVTPAQLRQYVINNGGVQNTVNLNGVAVDRLVLDGVSIIMQRSQFSGDPPVKTITGLDEALAVNGIGVHQYLGG